MTLWGLRLPVISAVALVVAFAGCGGGGGSAKRYDDVRKGAALLPREIALEFLQGIRSRPGRSVLGNESVIPPCKLTNGGITSRGEYKKGTQEVRFPKYTRYVEDAADMARIIRGEKTPDYSYEHDLTVQETLLKSCALPLDR